MMPAPETVDSWQGSIMEMKEKIRSFELSPEFKSMGESKLNNLKSWFDERLDKAIKASEEDDGPFEVSASPAILHRFTAGIVSYFLTSFVYSLWLRFFTHCFKSRSTYVCL